MIHMRIHFWNRILDVPDVADKHIAPFRETVKKNSYLSLKAVQKMERLFSLRVYEGKCDKCSSLLSFQVNSHPWAGLNNGKSIYANQSILSFSTKLLRFTVLWVL